MMVSPIETFCTWYLSRKYRVIPVIESPKARWERERDELITKSLALGMMGSSHVCGYGDVDGLRKHGPIAVLRNSLGEPIKVVKLEPVYIPPTVEETADDCL